MMRTFGITFDVELAGRPDTEEHAQEYVRRWAAFFGTETPADATVTLTRSEGSATEGVLPTIRVAFGWE